VRSLNNGTTRTRDQPQRCLSTTVFESHQQSQIIRDTAKPSCLAEKLTSKHVILTQIMQPALETEPNLLWGLSGSRCWSIRRVPLLVTACYGVRQ